MGTVVKVIVARGSGLDDTATSKVSPSTGCRPGASRIVARPREGERVELEIEQSPGAPAPR